MRRSVLLPGADGTLFGARARFAAAEPEPSICSEPTWNRMSARDAPVSSIRDTVGAAIRWLSIGARPLRQPFLATTMLTAGVPGPVVAGQLGRARFSTRLNVYRHFLETGDKVATDVLAKIMDKAALIPQERDARE